MTYDFSNPNQPGFNAPLNWIADNVRRLAPELEDRSKILIGLNLYGNDYRNGGNGDTVVGSRYLDLLRSKELEFEWDDGVAEHVATYEDDELELHHVYFPTLKSISDRLDLIEELGAGISMWEIGEQAPYLQSKSLTCNLQEEFDKMGQKGSKNRPATAAATKDAEAPKSPPQQSWADSELSKAPWTVPKLLATENDEIKKKFKAFCKASEAATKLKLGECIECYDDIAKRRQVFQASQRCGDSSEKGEEILESQGRKIVDKYCTESSSKDLCTLLGTDRAFELTESSSFDVLQQKITEYVESNIAKC
ncbi:Chitinase domain-containing protein 1 [Irineochytrium annulatum]|nr:Chitinase domain-containing protein 1 [Irineochytrium annulatum]